MLAVDTYQFSVTLVGAGHIPWPGKRRSLRIVDCSPALSPSVTGRALPERPNVQNCAAGALI